MKKIISGFIISIFIFFLYNCGIEDNVMYFQEPRNIEIDDTDQGDITVKFYGFNQEEEDGKYLFVGYDIYYRFKKSDNPKMAQVRNPIPPLNEVPPISNLHYFALHKFKDNSRFPNDSFSDTDMDEFYQIVSIPVTEDMIKHVLKKGNNDDVQFCFDKSHIIPGEENPYEDSKNIFINDIFPNYDDYKNYKTTWGNYDNIDPDKRFKGFYDKDYYDHYGIKPTDTDGISNNYYKVDFWIVAKGFNSNSERDKNFIESIKSEVFTVEFRVAISTEW